MKTIFKSLILLVTLSFSLIAQQPEIGFVRIVNAVSPGTGNASFLVDGRDLHADGYALGQTTGGYGVKAGNIDIEVRKQEVESGRTRINLGIGETMTVVAFAERLPAKKPEDPPKWTIKLLRLKQQGPERGYGVSLVSVCKPEEIALNLTVEGKDEPVRAFANRLAISKADLGGKRGEIMVSLANRVIANISPDSPGNYVIILYENAGGTIEALSYYDPKFVIAG
ncbi:MAG: hypothetical protein WED15_06555 [Akkermansiaceae bacterium]